MSLSAGGRKLLPAARRVLNELAGLKPLFETPLNGKIRVGIPDDFDEGVLERALAVFARTNPGVEVLATSGCTAGFTEAIREGLLDIAVCSGPKNVPGEPFLEQQPVWVASETMCIPSTDPVPLAVINHGCWLGELPKTALRQQGRSYNLASSAAGS